jgi:glyoxalase family protein
VIEDWPWNLQQMNITGLHHVTAIASQPQPNLDFYVGLLGLRLVKRTVNFDDTGTYHFYFGDRVGTPGTILTFFPWPNARRGVRGSGEIEATAFAIPAASVGYWLERLKEYHVSVPPVSERFGAEVICFSDNDGTLIELIASTPADDVQPWSGGAVPAEYSIRGLHGVSAVLKSREETATLLTESFGYRLMQEAGNRVRFVAPGEGVTGKSIDLVCSPGAQPSRLGAGSVHHIAFRVQDEAQQAAWREKLINLDYSVSPLMDRIYFRSIYFHEPGGILFEIATDPPGFTKDETADELGAELRLPPWLEAARSRIEEVLPKIAIPIEVGR